MGLLRRIGAWLYDRSQLDVLRRAVLDHAIPPEIGRTRKGWLYVFGQALVVLFFLQILTGSALVTKYIPAPEHAWDSLRYLNQEVTWGGFVRALHYFGASGMVVIVFIHMVRVFLTGSYKYPRELSWITGVVLLFLVLAMAFTGQLLRWDQDGVWTVMVAAQFAGRTPFIGQHLAELILGSETLSGATLSRFFAIHVVVLPLLILGLVGFHVYLVIRNGVSEPPRAGHPVDRVGYRAWYRKRNREGGSRFWPDQIWREMVFVALLLLVVFGLAWAFGPRGPGPVPDPTALEADPRPDWYFLWYYALIWFKPPALDEVVLFWLPLGVGAALLLLPLVFGGGERAPSRRPWAVASVAAAFLIWGTLTWFGFRPYWVPDFATEPRPVAELADASLPVQRGAQAYFDRGCQYCHAVEGRGGAYGPDLTQAALRMSPEEMTARIVMGIRDMPGYRDVLTPEELEWILAYLRWTAGGDR